MGTQARKTGREIATISEDTKEGKIPRYLGLKRAQHNKGEVRQCNSKR